MPKNIFKALFPEVIHDLSVAQEMKAISTNDKFIKEYMQQETKSHKKYLYNIPICVISRGQYPHAGAVLTKEQKLIERLQAELATRSTSSSHIVCEPGTGHYIHHQHPEVVVNAIRKLF